MSPETKKKARHFITSDWSLRSTSQYIAVVGLAIATIFGGGERVVGGIASEVRFRDDTKERNEQQKKVMESLNEIRDLQMASASAAQAAAMSSIRAESRMDSLMTVFSQKMDQTELAIRDIRAIDKRQDDVLQKVSKLLLLNEEEEKHE